MPYLDENAQIEPLEGKDSGPPSNGFDAPVLDAQGRPLMEVSVVGGQPADPHAVPDDAQIEPADPNTGFLHNAGVLAGGVVHGLGDLADLTTNAPNAIAAKMLGGPGIGDQVQAWAHLLGVDPQTAGQRILEAAGRGMGAALPTGGAGLVPAALASATGAASGAAGEVAKQDGYGAGGQLAASLVGGLGVGGLAGAARSAAAPFLAEQQIANGTRTLSPLAQDFQDVGVSPIAADVGGTLSRMTTGISNMTLGGLPLAKAAQRSVDQARAARSAIAEQIGQPFRTIEGQTDTAGAGLAAQRGVRAGLAAGGTKTVVGEDLYRAIPIAADRNAVVNNTRNYLNSATEGFKSNEALSQIWADHPKLRATLEALTPETSPIFKDGRSEAFNKAVGNQPIGTAFKDGSLSWSDLNRFRSIVGRIIGQPGLQADGDQIAALRGLYGALSSDMEATAAGAGGKALGAFKRANNYWRGLEARRAEVLAPLLGKDLNLNGEAAFRQIERWSTNQGGDAFALGRALRSMPEAEADDIRATVFDKLGTVSKGRQDQTGTVFSPNDLVTHWNGLSSRAKSVLFPGADYRESIDKLVRVAAAQKGAQSYANVSKTGNVVNGLALLTGFFHNPLTALPFAGSELGLGWALGNARMARWLASAPSKPNAAAALAHVNRLSSIAASEPQIANNVLKLQERLAQAFSDSQMPLAAQQPDDKHSRIIRQNQQ